MRSLLLSLNLVVVLRATDGRPIPKTDDAVKSVLHTLNSAFPTLGEGLVPEVIEPANSVLNTGISAILTTGETVLPEGVTSKPVLDAAVSALNIAGGRVLAETDTVKSVLNTSISALRTTDGGSIPQTGNAIKLALNTVDRVTCNLLDLELTGKVDLENLLEDCDTTNASVAHTGSTGRGGGRAGGRAGGHPSTSSGADSDPAAYATTSYPPASGDSTSATSDPQYPGDPAQSNDTSTAGGTPNASTTDGTADSSTTAGTSGTSGTDGNGDPSGASGDPSSVADGAPDSINNNANPAATSDPNSSLNGSGDGVSSSSGGEPGSNNPSTSYPPQSDVYNAGAQDGYSSFSNSDSTSVSGHSTFVSGDTTYSNFSGFAVGGNGGGQAYPGNPSGERANIDTDNQRGAVIASRGIKQGDISSTRQV